MSTETMDKTPIQVVKSNEEILMTLFNAEDEEDLQMSITLNPQLKFFIEAMDEARRDAAIGFTEWFVSDENPYQQKYSSDDDNNGKWYDYFRDGIYRHYYTTSELYSLYLSQLNNTP